MSYKRPVVVAAWALLVRYPLPPPPHTHTTTNIYIYIHLWCACLAMLLSLSAPLPPRCFWLGRGRAAHSSRWSLSIHHRERSKAAGPKPGGVRVCVCGVMMEMLLSVLYGCCRCRCCCLTRRLSFLSHFLSQVVFSLLLSFTPQCLLSSTDPHKHTNAHIRALIN